MKTIDAMEDECLASSARQELREEHNQLVVKLCASTRLPFHATLLQFSEALLAGKEEALS